MTYKVGLQMEPFELLDLRLSTSLLLALEAQKRGHELYHFTPEQVSFRDGEVTARVRKVELARENTPFFKYEDSHKINLRDLDVVLMRQDQPFSLKYVTNTHLLERIHPETFVVNDPRHVRKAADKWFVTRFTEIIPPTLISTDIEEIRDFRKEHGDLMLKPLFGPSGEGRYHLTPDSDNLDAYFEMFQALYGQSIIAQKFIGRVDNCDRRVILIDGKPIGAYDRIVKPGESRATVASGGVPTKAEMEARDYEICNIVGPTLKELGILIATIDIVNGYMIEVNVNSPIGIPRINHFDGINAGGLFWDAIEERLG